MDFWVLNVVYKMLYAVKSVRLFDNLFWKDTPMIAYKIYIYIILIKFLVIFLDFHWFSFIFKNLTFPYRRNIHKLHKNLANIATSAISFDPKQRQYSVFVFPQIHADFKYFVTPKFSLKSMSQLEM